MILGIRRSSSKGLRPPPPRSDDRQAPRRQGLAERAKRPVQTGQFIIAWLRTRAPSRQPPPHGWLRPARAAARPATTACGASRPASRTKRWHGTTTSTGLPDWRKASTIPWAWSWSCKAGPSATTISSDMAGHQAARGGTCAHHTASAPPSPQQAWHECCFATATGCDTAPKTTTPANRRPQPCRHAHLPGPQAWPASLPHRPTLPC